MTATTSHTNGSIARPFYVMAHNPNSLADAQAALRAGANALAPDINVYEADPTQLCICHGEGDSDAIPLEAYVQGLRGLMQQEKNSLALVIFDCKPKACTPEFGTRTLEIIRTHLTADIHLPVMLSVAKLEQVALFERIKGNLRPTEGLAIDEEDNPDSVCAFFARSGITSCAYGNGISVGYVPLTAPEVRPAIEQACAMRAANGRPTFIYPWTINDAALMEKYIRLGVDGLITDSIETLKSVVSQHPAIRLATQHDVPMQSLPFAYSLAIHTGKALFSGTDATITFTLEGSNGSASMSVETNYPYRMGRDSWTYVTLFSGDLGDLRNITVESDGSGLAPDWYLDRIRVQSHHHQVDAVAEVYDWIRAKHSVTRPLVPHPERKPSHSTVS